MDINNFPGAIKAYGLLEASDIVMADDLIMIGKKVNNSRDFNSYPAIPMTLLEFSTLFGGGGSQTLAQTLAFGNNTGDLFIVAPDNTSKFGILSGGQLDWSADNGGYSQSWVYADPNAAYFGYNNNYLEVSSTKIELSSGTGKVHADATDVWIAGNYDQRGFYVTDAAISGSKIIAMQTTELLVKHNAQITLDSLIINFPQIAALSVGNAVLYTDVAGNLVPITPTIDGYVLTLATGIPTWAAVPGQNAFGAVGSIDTTINDTLSPKQLATANVVNINSTGGGSASLLLADAAEGFSKRIVLTTLGIPVTVTPANFRNYNGVPVTLITFTNIGDAADLVFNDGKWTVISVSPSTIVS